MCVVQEGRGRNKVCMPRHEISSAKHFLEKLCFIAQPSQIRHPGSIAISANFLFADCYVLMKMLSTTKSHFVGIHTLFLPRHSCLQHTSLYSRKNCFGELVYAKSDYNFYG